MTDPIICIVMDKSEVVVGGQGHQELPDSAATLLEKDLEEICFTL